ncbi:MAG: extracellular solute-binding protein, partial [Firmicutes bacterium]|nr:extracellular solute-binding protein [Bacillota bacterium]
PHFTDSPPYFHAETGWSLVVAESSRNKEAAWKFVKFMIDRKSSETWNTVTGTIPAMKEIAEDPAFRAKWAILEPSFNVLPYGKFVGDVVNREIVWEISMDEFQAVIYGRKSVDKALEDMTKRINYEIDIY